MIVKLNAKVKLVLYQVLLGSYLNFSPAARAKILTYNGKTLDKIREEKEALGAYK